MLKINVITLFPNLFEEHLKNLPFKKAVETKAIEISLIDLKDFAVDKRGTVDDKPYGGGAGMVLMLEPIVKALDNIPNKEKIILMSPAGQVYNQKKARELTLAQNITIICGRYEGIDERIKDYCTDTISIGNYVLSGGELPALVVCESICRLLPGVLEKSEASRIESFEENFLEYPQYTRPEDFRGKKVPSVLLSGNHREIEKWRNKKRVRLI